MTVGRETQHCLFLFYFLFLSYNKATKDRQHICSWSFTPSQLELRCLLLYSLAVSFLFFPDYNTRARARARAFATSFNIPCLEAACGHRSSCVDRQRTADWDPDDFCVAPLMNFSG